MKKGMITEENFKALQEENEILHKLLTAIKKNCIKATHLCDGCYEEEGLIEEIDCVECNDYGRKLQAHDILKMLGEEE